MKRLKRTIAVILVVALVFALAGCGAGNAANTANAANNAAENAAPENTAPAENAASSEPAPASAEKNGEVMILFTSDVHCGVEQGFGYAGLYQIRQSLEDQGYTTLLVDDGDSIQGETLGMLTKGEAITELMNAMKYDLAIPGNHEFDYGADRFLELAQKADFPYISCNFTKNGELVFKPYIIKEAAGIKIAFVGLTTPKTISVSTPKYFQNEAGEYIYGFMQDLDGKTAIAAVQKAVDDARAEGADYVYLIGHLGMRATDSPWSYADVVGNTSGIDVVLDGHSHDTEQIVMKNKDGDPVVRSGCGTKLSCIGYSRITKEDGPVETDIWKWSNSTSMPQLLGIENEITKKIEEAQSVLSGELSKVVAKANVQLTIYDPEAKDSNGKPIRMVRRAETNLGDFAADAILWQARTDVAIMNGGGIRVDIKKGDVTYGDIISVFPFGNELCIVKATGQQIMDALEWGSRAIPGELGGFLQVAGMSYEIDPSVPSGCVADENNMLVRIEGPRRVRNVMIGGKPIDPSATYTVACMDYTILEHGDGHTEFDGAELVAKDIKLDNQLLLDYIVEELGGEIGARYADPYGDGRIVILQQ